MKRAWFALLAVAGCNSIFGNETVGVRPADALLGIDARDGTMTLTYAVTDGDPMAMPTATGFADTVQVGKLDDIALHTDPRAVAVTGTFSIPAATLQALAGYRLIYKAPDGIDVEFQSHLADAHFVVPRIGRQDRTPPPANAAVPFGFASGGPNNQAGSWMQGRFIETGRLWAVLDLGLCCQPPRPAPATIPYAYFASASGPLGMPGSSETFVFTDSNVDDGVAVLDDHNSKVFAYATMKTSGFDASGAPISPVLSGWIIPPAAATNYLAWRPPNMDYDARAFAIYPAGVRDAQYAAGGIIASTTVMPFAENVLNVSRAGATNGDLDHVAMAFLSRSSLQPIRFANPYNGTDAPVYPTAVYVTGGVERTFANTTTTVRSGIQTVNLVPAYLNSQTHLAPVAFDEGVGLATTILIVPTKPYSAVEATPTDLLLSDDHTTIPRSTTGSQPTLALTFAHDAAGAAAAPNDCTVTVFRVEAAALTAIKRYLVIMPLASPLLIDQGLFDTTSDYTLGITCYRGHPGASTGDFRAIAFPFASSTVYTHSFKVSPARLPM